MKRLWRELGDGDCVSLGVAERVLVIEEDWVTVIEDVCVPVVVGDCDGDICTKTTDLMSPLLRST